MFVKQISVFLENKSGSLCAMTRLLGEGAIDILAISIADTQNFGIVRLVVRSCEIDRAADLLRDNGYTVRVSGVICVGVPDRPAGLSEILTYLETENISIEYLYSFVRGADKCALIIFRLAEPGLGLKLFEEKGVRIVTQSEVDAL